MRLSSGNLFIAQTKQNPHMHSFFSTPHPFTAVSTCYSPTAVALSDMLRAQLALTRQLIAGSRHTAHSLAASITPSHHYTTLEDTKQASSVSHRCACSV